jgi:hypothetical protein
VISAFVYFLLVMMAGAPRLSAYAVLTHEAIIDSAWDDNIKPILLKRFPNATADELNKAHAYAYGGCIIQDMGYYPLGSQFFSDLAHYVRSGDFVVNMIADAQDLNEYAFALGSLAHYVADTMGHPIAVNRAVPLEYPKLKRKFGSVVTYADDKPSHLKTEFGFDVLQVARGSYAPKAYHDFIGFEVSKPLLERAFLATYSLELKEAFTSVDLALGTYRRTVSTLLPEATKVAWDLKKDELKKDKPGLTRKKFRYNLSRASFEKEWGHDYSKPGVGARILAFFFRIVPKFGPFRGLAIKMPTPETAKLFEDSFNRTLDQYRKFLADAGRGKLVLENIDFDTGKPTAPGEYRLADATYEKLAQKLAQREAATVDAKLRANVLGFFRDLHTPLPTDVQAAVQKLRAE